MAQEIFSPGAGPTSPSAYCDADAEPPLNERTIVSKEHVATDASQLNLQVDDIVIVLEKDSTGWWGGHKDGEEQTGWFPGNCVTPLAVQTGSLQAVGSEGTVSTAATTAEFPVPSRRDDEDWEARVEQLTERRGQVSADECANPEAKTAPNGARTGAVAPRSPTNVSLDISMNESQIIIDLRKQIDEVKRQTELAALKAEEANRRAEDLARKLQAEQKCREKLEAEAAQERRDKEQERRRSQTVERDARRREEEFQRESERIQQALEEHERAARDATERARIAEDRAAVLREELAIMSSSMHSDSVVAEPDPVLAATTHVPQAGSDGTRRRLFTSSASVPTTAVPVPVHAGSGDSTGSTRAAASGGSAYHFHVATMSTAGAGGQRPPNSRQYEHEGQAPAQPKPAQRGVGAGPSPTRAASAGNLTPSRHAELDCTRAVDEPVERASVRSKIAEFEKRSTTPTPRRGDDAASSLIRLSQGQPTPSVSVVATNAQQRERSQPRTECNREREAFAQSASVDARNVRSPTPPRTGSTGLPSAWQTPQLPLGGQELTRPQTRPDAVAKAPADLRPLDTSSSLPLGTEESFVFGMSPMGSRSQARSHDDVVCHSQSSTTQSSSRRAADPSSGLTGATARESRVPEVSVKERVRRLLG